MTLFVLHEKWELPGKVKLKQKSNSLIRSKKDDFEGIFKYAISGRMCFLHSIVFHKNHNLVFVNQCKLFKNALQRRKRMRKGDVAT